MRESMLAATYLSQVAGVYLCQSGLPAAKNELIRYLIIKLAFCVIMFHFATNQNTVELGKIKLNAFIQTS
jgi:hypothetical protein